MEFLVFTYVGLAAALVHALLPRSRWVGPSSAIALGLTGGWGGALLAGTLIRGGWANFGALQLAGSIVGAVVAVEGVERLAVAYLRRDPEEAEATW